MIRNRERVLILGADGFIGSNLTKSLLKDGNYEIRVFDLFKNGISRNLESDKDKIEFYPGDFLNKSDIKKALKDVDYVFHLVSLTTPGSSMNDPIIDIDTNIRGTVSLLDECVKNDIKKFIFSSSGGSIYGNQNKEKYSERDKTKPISPYAISKLAVEKYLEYYKTHKGLDYLILRYSNPYGRNQNIIGSQGIVPIFLNLVAQKEPITIFGDGENVRDYIYIDDLVDTTKRLFDKNSKYDMYNIGSGEGVSINEVVDTIKEVTGEDVKIKRTPQRSIDVRRIVLNTDRIKKEVDCKKLTPLKEGIKRTWKWIQSIFNKKSS